MPRLVAALALLLAPAAVAQLDLPDKNGRDTTPPGLKQGRAGDIAPHLTCTVCYEANYTATIDWQAADGLQKAHCSVCQTLRSHYLPRAGKGGSKQGVDLPMGNRLPARKPAAELGKPEEVLSKADQDPAEQQLSRAAEQILLILNGVDSVDDPVAVQAGETLLALGASGRVAARLALADERAAKMLTGVRVLLRSGVPEDADNVVARLRRRMPIKAASAALTELIELDPVRATPKLLCELLGHPQKPVRSAADRHLRSVDLVDMLPFLVPQLESERSDTRQRAVELIASGDHPLRRDLLLTRLADSRAKVARRVIESLSEQEDPLLNEILLATAFGERWVLRTGAFALIALMEREDTQLCSLLTMDHVEALLRGLESADPFLSGTCAAALAGIGFRSEAEEVSAWLDGVVPERLVGVVSGFDFFDDHEALIETAQRRLKMVTGNSFGSNGPAWAEWWLNSRETFVASRAVLPVADGDERGLSLAFMDRSSGEAFVLVGPDLVAEAPVDQGEVFFLDSVTAKELVGFLDSQGVLGLECLPGARGALTDSGRVIDVRFGDRGKNFIVGIGTEVSWFEHMVGRAKALAERCTWQRFPDPDLHADRLGLYRAEGAWWAGDHDAAARSKRLKQLVLQRALALPVSARDSEVAALAELYTAESNVDVADFPTLLALLGEEPWLGGRAESIVRAARAAAGTTGSLAATEPEVAKRLWMLIGTLHERFSAEAMPLLAGLIADAGHPFARAAAADSRPIVRAVACHSLSLGPGDGELAILRTLLEDEVVNVEVAAVEAVGRGRLVQLLDVILERAKQGNADVRVGALAAIGHLGGPGVRDTLTLALTDTDARFRLAATRGLANLQDPSTASLFVSLLRQKGTPGTAPIVREALMALGEAAEEELFMAMRSPSMELQREAALLLARQGVPAAAVVLIELLASDQVDAEIARELAVLTCVDMRSQVDPAEAWFRWLDGVKRNDSLAWLRAAAETLDIQAPESEAFADPTSRDVIGFLVEVMSLDVDFIAERSRRELERFLGRKVGDLPMYGAERDAWLVALLEALEGQR